MPRGEKEFEGQKFTLKKMKGKDKSSWNHNINIPYY